MKIKFVLIILFLTLLTVTTNVSAEDNSFKQDEFLIEYMYLYDFNGDSTDDVFYDLIDIRKKDHRIGFVFAFPMSNLFKIDLIAAYSFLFMLRKDYNYNLRIYHTSTNEYSFETYGGTSRGDVIVFSIVPCFVIKKFQFGIGPSFSMISWKMKGTLTIDYPSSPEKNSIKDHKYKNVFMNVSLLHFRCNIKIRRFGFGISSDILKNKHGIQINFVLVRGIIFN